MELFFDNIGNYYDFCNYELSKHEIDFMEDKEIKELTDDQDPLTKEYAIKYIETNYYISQYLHVLVFVMELVQFMELN